MGKNFTTIQPSTAQILSTRQYMDCEELGEKLSASRQAFEIWKVAPTCQRIELVRQLATQLAAAKSELAALSCLEMGKPLTQAIQEVEKCVLTCHYYATHGEELLERLYIPTEAARSYVSWQPLGPILAIMPWNFPYWQVIRVAAPALIAGNSLIVKHADNTTGCALALQKVFDAVGFPEGTVQTIIADHADIPNLIHSSATAAITLTGSEAAGRKVAALAGSALKKHVLELGGSDAYVILHDADIALAASICAASRLINSGQSCIAAKRFVIDQTVYNKFIEAFVEKVKSYQVGLPELAETQVGPLAKASIRDEVSRQVEASIAKGAKLAYQGTIPEGDGFWYPITVLSEVEPGMPAFDEEVFGPVAAMICAPDEETAIALANQSRFGLGAAIFSQDIERAERLAEERIEAGMCYINAMVVSDPRLPFGGIKTSGYGRELSSFGLREFINIKTIVVR